MTPCASRRLARNLTFRILSRTPGTSPGEVGGPRPGAGAKGPGQETVTRWDEVMDFLSDVNFAPRSPGLRIDSM
eukprot:g27317.t1